MKHNTASVSDARYIANEYEAPGFNYDRQNDNMIDRITALAHLQILATS
jgi:hypothetical protein